MIECWIVRVKEPIGKVDSFGRNIFLLNESTFDKKSILENVKKEGDENYIFEECVHVPSLKNLNYEEFCDVVKSLIDKETLAKKKVEKEKLEVELEKVNGEIETILKQKGKH